MSGQTSGANLERYRVLRTLGRGGMGLVQLVWDSVREEQVARKRILEVSGETLLRFKREFRTVESLRHPGLATLYELGEDAEGAYFTMEFVPGTSVLSHCSADDALVSHSAVVGAAPTDVLVEPDRMATTRTQRAPAGLPFTSGHARPAVSPDVAHCDWARLEPILEQLVDALAFLHEHHIVHCDLKPSNVLVRDDGRVKVLDFGLAVDLGDPLGPGPTAGTLPYMAPECFRGAPPSPAVDSYALGVMLFELITGRLPFIGSAPTIAAMHVNVEPPRLDVVARGTPPKYVELCAALMRKDSARRPTLPEVARALGARPASQRRSSAAPGMRLVGRENLLSLLEARIEAVDLGASGLSLLEGTTGVGKTALAEALAARAAARGWRVLRGRASARELLPFNAIDGAVDDLARVLSVPELAPLRNALATPLTEASTAFPVLGWGAPAPTRSRARAFAGLCEVVARVAARDGVLLVVDDVQWADRDSVTFLDELVASASPRLALLLTVRSDVEENDAVAWARARAGAAAVSVAPLEDAAIAEIVLRVAGPSADPEAAMRVARSCAGKAFFGEIAGRALAHGSAPSTALPVWIAQRVRALPPGDREVLAAVIASGGWTPATDVAAAAGVRLGELDAALRRLEEDFLVRRARDAVDAYHDLVRVAASEGLEPAALVRAHRRYAARLEGMQAAPFRWVQHLEGAGEVARAALLARDAARLAENQRAYALAAEMYAVALKDPGGDELALSRARAHALDRAGAYVQAAEAWRRVGALVTAADDRLEARYQEARGVLASGDYLRGRALLDSVLADVGEAPLGRAGWLGLWSATSFLAGPIRRAAPSLRAMTGAERERVERALHIATAVAVFEPLRSLRLLGRAQAEFRRDGVAEGAAWCDYVFAMLAFALGPKRGPAPLAERYAARAAAWLGERAAEIPEVVLLPYVMEMLRGLRHGDWERSRRASNAGRQGVRALGLEGSNGHVFGLLMGAEIERFSQNVGALDFVLRDIHTAMRGLSDVSTRYPVWTLDAHLLSLRGEHGRALATLGEAQRELDRHGRMTAQSEASRVLRLAMIETTARGGDLATSRQLRDAFMAQVPRVFGHMYGGSVAAVWALCEARAVRRKEPAASPRLVRRFARATEGSPPLATTGALRALGYVAEVEGDPERALALFARAESEAAALGQGMDAAIARYQRGLRIGGDEGAALKASAQRAIVACGATPSLLDED